MIWHHVSHVIRNDEPDRPTQESDKTMAAAASAAAAAAAAAAKGGSSRGAMHPSPWDVQQIGKTPADMTRYNGKLYDFI